MTATYLNLTVSTTLDSNGNGTATLKPDANQYWAPDFVKVSTATQTQPFPYAAVYHVTPGVTVGPTSFIDDTYGGNNDTSSIISGAIVQFGESITCKWTGGTPGDTAIMTIYGMVSDQPIGFDLVPSSPGTHFSQRIGTAVDLPTQIDFANAFVMTSGTDNFFPPNGHQSFGNTYQVSHFESFRMRVSCQSSGTKPYFGVQFQWFADSAGSIQLDTDYFVFSSNGQDQDGVGIVKGPYLSLRLHNFDSINGTVSYNLYGSQRIEPRTQFRTVQIANQAQGLGIDNVLFNQIVSIAANTANVLTADFNFYNGPVTVNLWVSTTPNATKVIQVNLQALPNGVFNDDQLYEQYLPLNVDAKSPMQFNVAFPRRVVRALITNNDSILHHVHIYVVAQEL